MAAYAREVVRWSGVLSSQQQLDARETEFIEVAEQQKQCWEMNMREGGRRQG